MILQSLHEAKEPTESKEVLKAILMDKIRDEHKINQQVMKTALFDRLQAEMAKMIETSIVNDTIQLKYGFQLPDFMAAVKKHKLEEDEDVKNLRAELNAEMDAFQERIEEMANLTDEQEDTIWKGIQQTGGIELTVEGDEIPFRSIQQLYLCISQLTILLICGEEAICKEKRRKLLKKERDHEYRNCIISFMERRSLIIATVKSRVLEAFEVTHEKYDKTLQMYLNHAQYGKVLHDLANLVQDKRI